VSAAAASSCASAAIHADTVAQHGALGWRCQFCAVDLARIDTRAAAPPWQRRYRCGHAIQFRAPRTPAELAYLGRWLRQLWDRPCPRCARHGRASTTRARWAVHNVGEYALLSAATVALAILAAINAFGDLLGPWFASLAGWVATAGS
jgi:hypothetical protein